MGWVWFVLASVSLVNALPPTPLGYSTCSTCGNFELSSLVSGSIGSQCLDFGGGNAKMAPCIQSAYQAFNVLGTNIVSVNGQCLTLSTTGGLLGLTLTACSSSSSDTYWGSNGELVVADLCATPQPDASVSMGPCSSSSEQAWYPLGLNSVFLFPPPPMASLLPPPPTLITLPPAVMVLPPPPPPLPTLMGQNYVCASFLSSAYCSNTSGIPLVFTLSTGALLTTNITCVPGVATSTSLSYINGTPAQSALVNVPECIGTAASFRNNGPTETLYVLQKCFTQPCGKVAVSVTYGAIDTSSSPYTMPNWLIALIVTFGSMACLGLFLYVMYRLKKPNGKTTKGHAIPSSMPPIQKKAYARPFAFTQRRIVPEQEFNSIRQPLL